MNEKTLAREILTTLTLTTETTRYFDSNIQWLKDRVDQWQNNYIRIGLIGIIAVGNLPY